MILSDDVGSFPIAEIDGEALTKEQIGEIGLKILTQEATPAQRAKFTSINEIIIKNKILSGIDVIVYPQIQDMILEFFTPMEKFSDEPYIVKDRYARIPEVDATASIIEINRKSWGIEQQKIKVCVTGPLELYIKTMGLNVEGDLLKNYSESIGKFIKNTTLNLPYIKTKSISIDEPSLGINTGIVYESDDLIDAWNNALKPLKSTAFQDIDVQIHLHSSNCADIVYETEGIDVIGVESAEDPDLLDYFTRCDLEQYDKFLRVGISRSNIFGIAADFKDKTGIDIWRNNSNENLFLEMVNNMETPGIIYKRLEDAYEVFGDRIKYAGPDCGLGAWNCADSARQLLKNTADAVKKFNMNSA